MSIKKSQAILKCFKSLKCSVWFIRRAQKISEDETICRRPKCQLKPKKKNWHSISVEIFQVSSDEGMGK